MNKYEEIARTSVVIALACAFILLAISSSVLIAACMVRQFTRPYVAPIVRLAE